MSRSVDEINMRMHENGLSSLRIKIVGGETGDHMVDCLADEWHCDCVGFISHGHCRHIDTGKIIKEYIGIGLQQAKGRVEVG